MPATVTVWEPLPELNRKNEQGMVIIKRPEGQLKLLDMGKIYSCCGRAFLTLESLENHTKSQCLLLEANAEDRPLEFDKLYPPGYFGNLLVVNEIRHKRRLKLKQIEKLKSSLPKVTVVLEKIDPALGKRTKATPNLSLSDSFMDMPQLSPIMDQNCDDPEKEVFTPVTEHDSVPPVIEPIVPLWDLCVPEENNSHLEKENIYHCKFCSYTSNFKNNLKVHAKRQHRFSWKRNKRRMKHSSKPPKQNVQTSSQKKTSIMYRELSKKKYHQLCTLCGSLEYNLSVHIRTAHVDSDIKCPFCCCSFSTLKGRKIHIAVLHKKAISKKETTVIEDLDITDKTKGEKRIFQCKHCPLNFWNRFTWKYHMQHSHVSGGQFGCSFCTCSFKAKSSLKTHVDYHHRRENGQLHIITKRQTSTIKANPLRRPTICIICGKDLKTKLFLRIHTQVAHVPGGEPCNICPCKFSNKQNLESHMTRQHSALKEAPTKPEIGFVKNKKTRMSDIKDTNEESKENFIRCPEPECKCPILDKETLEMHLKLEHKHNKHKKSLECSFCMESFETNEERDLHSKRNHAKWLRLQGQTPGNKKSKVVLTCDKCPTKIYYPVQLKYHLRTAHNPLFKHKCSHCSCQYESENGLRFHVTKVHKSKNSKEYEKDSNIECPSCHRRFSKKNLQFHLAKAHVPNGKYQCQFCTCCYKLESELNRHVTQIHKMSSEGNSKPKVCDKCGWKCRDSKHLKSHLKSFHVPDGKFFCTMCSCRFSDRSRLTYHLSRMHNVLNYEIIKCDKCFIEVYSQSALILHKKLAHVTNGIECEHCPCKFTSKLYLDDHLKKDHRECENKNSAGVRTCRLVSPKNKIGPLNEKDNNTGETPKALNLSLLPCEVVNCSFKFRTATDRRKHMKSSHDEGHKFQCGQCPCAFANEFGLEVHLRWHRKRPVLEDLPNPVKKLKMDNNGNEKNSSVADFEKSVPAKERFIKTDSHNDSVDSSNDTSDVVEIHPPKLKRRQKTAPMNLTCRCKKCGTVFNSNVKLLDHLKNAHGVNSLFKCSVCESIFLNPVLLMNHLLTHAPAEDVRSLNKTNEIRQKISEKREKKTIKISKSKGSSNIKSRHHGNILENRPAGDAVRSDR